jgi:hypothetical protein
MEMVKASGDGVLYLSPISLNKEYAKKWNTSHRDDYVHLTRNGELLSNALYRKGGFGADLSKDYFLLLKYMEEYYKDSITKDPKKKPHLAGHWCILNKYGEEKVVLGEFDTPYLVNNSCIYHMDNKYYNIETNALYCTAYSHVESRDYLFLQNEFDDNRSKRGVLKINKKDGSYELYPA